MSRTIRLQNVDPKGTNLTLHLQRPMSVRRYRRGAVVSTPILIPRGQYYDICEKMQCSYEEAARLAQSPEVIAYERRGRLVILEHPPVPGVVTPLEKNAELSRDADAKSAALRAAKAAAEAAEAARDSESSGATPEVADAAEAAEADSEVAAVLEEAAKGEPSMDWTKRELLEYAEAEGVALEGEKPSKTAVLRAIREARA